MLSRNKILEMHSLWLEPEDWEVILSKIRESGGQLFWRVRARSQDGRKVFSEWRRFFVEDLEVTEE